MTPPSGAILNEHNEDASSPKAEDDLPDKHDCSFDDQDSWKKVKARKYKREAAAAQPGEAAGSSGDATPPTVDRISGGGDDDEDAPATKPFSISDDSDQSISKDMQDVVEGNMWRFN